MWWRSSHGSIELARDRTWLDRSPQLGQQCGADAGDRTKSVCHGHVERRSEQYPLESGEVVAGQPGVQVDGLSR